MTFFNQESPEQELPPLDVLPETANHTPQRIDGQSYDDAAYVFAASVRDAMVDAPAHHEQPDLPANEKPKRPLLVSSTVIGDLNEINEPEPPHVIDRMLPVTEVTLLAGDGGGGKSTLALSMAMHVASGRRFAGLKTQQGAVSFWSLEDRLTTCKRRVRLIGERLGITGDDMGGRLQILTRDDVGATLAGPSLLPERRGALETTPLFGALVNALPKKPALIIIDNASLAYCGNENDRAQVAWFVDSLIRVAEEKNCALLLIAHVNKSTAKGVSDNASYSGSTHWNSGPRSRLALFMSEDGTGELHHQKANLTAKLPPTEVTREGGVLLATHRPRAHQSVLKERAGAANAETVLRAIRTAVTSGVSVPANQSGPSTIFQWLRAFPGFPNLTVKELRAALMKLKLDGVLREVTLTDSNRNTRKFLTVVEARDDSLPVSQSHPRSKADQPQEDGARELRESAKNHDSRTDAGLRELVVSPIGNITNAGALQAPSPVTSELVPDCVSSEHTQLTQGCNKDAQGEQVVCEQDQQTPDPLESASCPSCDGEGCGWCS